MIKGYYSMLLNALKWRKGMWELYDRLHHKGVFTCKSKKKAMAEAEERVDYVKGLVNKT